MVVLRPLCHSCGLDYQKECQKHFVELTFLALRKEWPMAFIGMFVYLAHFIILLHLSIWSWCRWEGAVVRALCVVVVELLCWSWPSSVSDEVV